VRVCHVRVVVAEDGVANEHGDRHRDEASGNAFPDTLLRSHGENEDDDREDDRLEQEPVVVLVEAERDQPGDRKIPAGWTQECDEPTSDAANASGVSAGRREARNRLAIELDGPAKRQTEKAASAGDECRDKVGNSPRATDVPAGRYIAARRSRLRYLEAPTAWAIMPVKHRMRPR
jgi:hypothetical protein